MSHPQHQHAFELKVLRSAASITLNRPPRSSNISDGSNKKYRSKSEGGPINLYYRKSVYSIDDIDINYKV